MAKNIDIAQKTAKEITEVAVNFEIKGEPRQFTSSIAPIISNVMYNREKELLEYERKLTIIRLSKVLLEDTMLEVFDALKYKITI